MKTIYTSFHSVVGQAKTHVQMVSTNSAEKHFFN